MLLPDKFKRATLLLSHHCNGVSKFTPAHKRREIVVARAALMEELERIQNGLRADSVASDCSAVATDLRIVQQYLIHYESLVREHWNEGLIASKAIPAESRRLYAIATTGTDKDLDQEIRRAIDEGDQAVDRLRSFLDRFVVGLRLLDEVATEFGVAFDHHVRTQFTRSIEFPPEYKQAGMAILAYFGEVVRRKYPNMDCRVQIEQVGSRVTMLVETPGGEIERIEQELSSYSLVVVGKMTAEEYMPTEIDALALKQKLQIAKLEVDQTRELLQVQRAGFERQVSTLENQIGFLQTILDKTMYESAQNSSSLRAVAAQFSGSVAALLAKLADDVDKGTAVDLHELSLQLRDVGSQSPGIMDKLNELFVKGAIQGAAGNYLYAALQALQRLA
jgi:hypothetical protein